MALVNLWGFLDIRGRFFLRNASLEIPDTPAKAGTDRRKFSGTENDQDEEKDD